MTWGRGFGFERWSKRPPELDRATALARTEARDGERATLPAPVHASDWHPEAIEAVTRCVDQAGLATHIVIERVDARRAPMPGPRPVVVANLPFGERLAPQRLQLEGFYRTLGDRLAEVDGARALLFSAAADARWWLNLDRRCVGRPRRWSLSAGELPAQLLRWDLPSTDGPRPDPR